ncbi:cytochrome c oxidase assembly protein [Branchiibius sp. NY16-3462-2]|uniref:cytochrome c oxidase assembly protein n=1 Tax=Branchiibius sp. NY16-3462-2 TaxID=1807500 RepID=UPI00079643D1|nr:cytochrome c oxidase assembly protein [Branchiibius sp. NY16-3462-2]KYH45032.1 cytochrome C oxidase assembly protein [Branchiibius sp. NY16-3462-2]
MADPQRSRWQLGVPAVALAVLLGTTAIALAYAGGAAPLELGDPGAVVRWGLPLLHAVQDGALAVTFGAFLLGGLLVPESATSHRRLFLSRVAAWSATVWFLVAVVGIVFAYADVAGVPLGTSGLLGDAWTTTWQLEVLRAPAISALIGLVVAVCAWLRPGRNGQAWLFFITGFAILPLALVGHSATSNDHETGVNSLAGHVVSAALWAGGLFTLGLVWSRLGKSASDVVARFSKVATWCYVIVGVSGVVLAVNRLGSWSSLGTAYGVELILKAVLLAGLGVLGYLQRQRVVARLGEPTGGLFARLAAIEVLAMAAAFGLGNALARSAPPSGTVENADTVTSITGYPAPPAPTAANWFTQWRFDWLFTPVAVVAIGVYLVWAWRLHRRGDRWPVLRTISWVVGWLLFIYFVSGPPAVYGRVMFSAHMLQHMAISMLAPVFMVQGAVVTLALRALPKRSDLTLGPRELILAIVHSRYVGFFANPIVASLLFISTLIAFYYTPWFELSLRTHTGHVLMVIHFVLVGYLFAWAFTGIDPGPRRWSPPARLLVLLVAVAFHAFFGVALMTGTTLLAPDVFSVLHLSWVTDPLDDQQRGGTIAWGVGELPTLMMALLIAVEWARKDDADARRAERQAERDGDAELNAYNEMLSARSRGNR